MEPATAAALYGVEHVAEGAVAAAAVISQPTVPLRARFNKLPSVSTLARTGHTLNVIRGKAYIFGGKRADGEEDKPGQVFVVTLPSSLELDNIDYQTVAPENPDQSKPIPVPAQRSAHASTSVGTDIYIFGGRPATSPESAPLSEAGAVHRFSTSILTWTSLTPDNAQCSSGTPPPRTYASMTSTPHPLPSPAGEDHTLSPITSAESVPSIEDSTPAGGGGGGTLFLHGGSDSSGGSLTDTWAFDIPSRIWSRYPELPASTSPPPTRASSYMLHASSSLIDTGPTHNTIHTLPLSLDKFNDLSGSGELGVSPKPPGNWQAHSLISQVAAIQSEHPEALHTVEAKMGPSSHPQSAEYPAPRAGGGFVSVSTGAGREYAVLLPGAKTSEGSNGEELDMWTLQLPSEKGTGAAFKDRIRGLFGKDSGMGKWARCDVVQADKEDGVLPLPRGLEEYAYDGGGDWGSGDAVVMWGGRYDKERGGEVTGEGWVVTFA
ncbi:MAG: hypothetical protein Q9160_001397 [Pyrenula sp. 1 TL-2023]